MKPALIFRGKGRVAIEEKKNTTRGLMCISSKMLRLMKKSTCGGFRAHLFQELGMTKKNKFYL